MSTKWKSDCCLSDIVKGTDGEQKDMDICSYCYMPCKKVQATKVRPTRDPIASYIIPYLTIILASIVIAMLVMWFVN